MVSVSITQYIKPSPSLFYNIGLNSRSNIVRVAYGFPKTILNSCTNHTIQQPSILCNKKNYSIRQLEDDNNNIIFTSVGDILYKEVNLPKDKIVKSSNIIGSIITFGMLNKLVSEYKEMVGFNKELRNVYNKHLIDYYYANMNIDIRKLHLGNHNLLSLTDVYVIT